MPTAVQEIALDTECPHQRLRVADLPSDSDRPVDQGEHCLVSVLVVELKVRSLAEGSRQVRAESVRFEDCDRLVCVGEGRFGVTVPPVGSTRHRQDERQPPRVSRSSMELDPLFKEADRLWVVELVLLRGPIGEHRGALGNLDSIKVRPEPAELGDGFAGAAGCDRRPRRPRGVLNDRVDVAGLGGVVHEPRRVRRPTERIEHPLVETATLGQRQRRLDGPSLKVMRKRQHLVTDDEQTMPLTLGQLLVVRSDELSDERALHLSGCDRHGIQDPAGHGRQLCRSRKDRV